MTDRIKGFWVSLDEDIRQDDVEPIRKAIMMIKHVRAVKHSVANSDDWMNRDRIVGELRQKLFDVLQ